MTDLRLVLTYVSLLAAVTLAAEQCDRPPTPPRHARTGAATVSIPAGIHARSLPGGAGSACGTTTRRLETPIRAVAPGGWIAIDTDAFARVAEIAHACARTSAVWIDSNEGGHP